MGQVIRLDNYPSERAPFPYTFPIDFTEYINIRTITQGRVIPIAQYAALEGFTESIPEFVILSDFNADFNEDFGGSA